LNSISNSFACREEKDAPTFTFHVSKAAIEDGCLKVALCNTDSVFITGTSAKTNINHIDLDVDDSNYDIATLNKHSGECLSCKIQPTLKVLLTV
jgi:hypothetical protein